MNIQNNGINLQRLSFGAHKKELDDKGGIKHNFLYLFDLDKYSCDLEMYNIIQDKNGNVMIDSNKKPVVLHMIDGRISVDTSDYPELDTTLGFAYRYKLTDKTNKKESYAFDNGEVINIFDKEKSDNKYNVIYSNRAIINKNGPMQLIMPDIYYPGIIGKNGKYGLDKIKRNEAISSVRTHANKLGGNFYGIINRLPQLEEEGIKRIVGTPYTKDQISSHKYWTENAFQISPDFGNEDDFKLFQIELFKHNMNWIADAALVNEGFGGIHVAQLLRKGPETFAKNMFRSSDKVSLGIIPDDCKYTRMKIINAPFIIEDGIYNGSNPKYNPKKPTYIQFYDKRLADEKQIHSDDPFALTTYSKKNTDNIYDITHHDDAVYPFPIEVHPYELKRNIARIAAGNNKKVDLSDVNTMKRASDFTYFNVVNKSDAGGLEVWDGNVDIAKSLFYTSGADDKKFVNLPPEEKEQAMEAMHKGSMAVRDYALNSGKFWTKMPYNSLIDYMVGQFGGFPERSDEYYNTIQKLVGMGDLPKTLADENILSQNVIDNVVNHDYKSILLDESDFRDEVNPEGVDNSYTLSDYILRHTMDFPLEALPVSNNMLGILTSPYLSKKPNKETEVGVSRYDLYKAENPNLPKEYEETYNAMESLYNDEIVPIIQRITEPLKGLENEDEITDYGKFVINLVTPELTKYIFVKALAPDTELKFIKEGPLKGHIDFSNVNSEDISMQSLGIAYGGKTSKDEAQIVLNALKKGIENIPDEEITRISKELCRRYKNISENDFRIAEMLVDRTESGLGWRIDASKDVADIDAVRQKYDTMTTAWDNVIDFWKKYNESVLAINPHAYTTAEVTDLSELFDGQNRTVYKSSGDAERKFLAQTGITTLANYNYFYTQPIAMFSKSSFETNDQGDNSLNGFWQAKEDKNCKLREKFAEGWLFKDWDTAGFLFQSPDDGIINSYTFVDNHDKPRILHGLGLDMNLFYSDFTDQEHIDAASKCLMRDAKDINFKKVKPSAIAMGTKVDECLESVAEQEPWLKDNLENAKKAVSHLASGVYKGRKFDADAFGTRPYEVVIKTVFDELMHMGTKIDPDVRADIEAKMLKEMLAPAIDRYLSIYKTLIAIPGSPTDFAGDRVGSTGFETKAKNYTQQNRNVIHWEWLQDGKYEFIKDLYNKMNEIAALRDKKELSALNDGATVFIPIIESSEYDEIDKETNEKTGRKIKTFNQSDYFQALLRYNDEGSMVITLHDNMGASTKYSSLMERKDHSLPYDTKSIAGRLILGNYKLDTKDEENNKVYKEYRKGLMHGLKEGTQFKNQNPNDLNTYKIAKITEDDVEYYYLQCLDPSGKEVPITIKPEDLNTMILYKVD